MTAAENPVVGRVDGQTAWTGINQDGVKTMSYQFAVIVKANKALSDIFEADRAAGRATQIGWWLPQRGEGAAEYAEKWTMTLVDVYLQSSVYQSTLEVRQTNYTKGLYDQPGSTDIVYNDD